MKKKSGPAEDDLIWGIHPVLELVKHRPQQIEQIFCLKKNDRLAEIIALAGSMGVPVRHGRLPQALSSGTNHQGVAARIKPYSTIRLDRLLAQARNFPAPLLLALDSIQDPHNLGAIIRSAAAAGVTGIILPRDRSVSLSGTVVKSSAGALAFVDVCQVTNLANTLDILKKQGFWIYGAAARAARSIYNTDFSGAICLVIGGEKKGIQPLVEKHCDFLVSVPLAGVVESLNASVAAGVILFEVVRQRRQEE